MAESPECLTAVELQALVDGNLPISRQTLAESHLESCEACRRNLEAMADQGRLIPPQIAAAASATRSMALEDAMQKLKSDTDDPEETLVTDSHSPSWLPTLGSSDDPRSLGRLGNYEILEVIGRGGMGTVFNARDQRLDRLVAVKVLNPDLAASGPARQRFLQEARSAAAVTHDHVVTIHAVDEAGGAPFLVMEYILGVSLADRIQRSGHLRVEEILRIGMQAASGLAAAHAQGIVHRDIKPANILLENGIERVKLSDFGLARVIHEAQMTNSGAVAGTPEYMSPEQACGEPVDHRSDLFSLGSVMYAMCVGRSPFRADTAQGAMHRVREHTARPIQETNPDIPDWLVVIINRLLEKKPENRYQSAEELAEVLGGYLAHVQQPSRAKLPSPVVPRNLFERSVRRIAPTLNLPSWLMTLSCVLLFLVIPITMWINFQSSRKLSPYLGQNGSPTDHRENPPTNPRAQAGKLKLNIPIKGVAVSLGTGIQSRSFRTSVEIEDLSGIVDVEVLNLSTQQVLSRGSIRLDDHSPRHLDVADDCNIYHPIDPQQMAVAELPTPLGPVTFASALSNNLYAATVTDDNLINIWTLTDSVSAKLCSLSGHSDMTTSLTFSPMHNLVASASKRGPIRLWSYETKREHRQILPGDSECRSVAISPDGTELVAGFSNGTIRFWNVETGEQIGGSLTHGSDVLSIAFSADGLILATAGSDGSIMLWDVPERHTLRIILGHSAAIDALTFSPNAETLASVSRDTTIKLWDVPSGQMLASCVTRGPLHCMSISTDGRLLAAAGTDQQVRIWEVSPDNELSLRHEFHAHWSTITAMTFDSAGRKLLTTSTDNSIKLWDIEELEIKEDLLAPQPMTTFASYRKRTGNVGAWNMGSGASIVFSTTGDRLAATDTQGSLRVWDMASLQEVFSVDLHEPLCFDTLVFSPDGKYLFLCTNKNLRGWDTASWQLRFSVEIISGCSHILVSPDNKEIFTCHFDGNVQIWSRTGDQIKSLQSPYGRPTSAAISPDGSVLLIGTSTGEIIRVESATRASHESPLKHGEGIIETILYSRDGGFFATSSLLGGTVRIWDSESFRLRSTLHGHTGVLQRMAISGDGRMLVVSGGAGTKAPSPTNREGIVTIWDLTTTRTSPVTQFVAHPDSTVAVTISPDMTMLATTGRDGKVHLWSVDELLRFGGYGVGKLQEGEPVSNASNDD